MAAFSFWSSSPIKSTDLDTKSEKHVEHANSNSDDPTKQTLVDAVPARVDVASEPSSPKDIPLPASPLSPPLPIVDGNGEQQAIPEAKRPNGRGLAYRSFSFLYSSGAHHEEHKPVLSTEQDHQKKARAAAAFSRRFSRQVLPNADKRAKESALIVRSLIVGPSSIYPSSSKPTKAVSKPQLKKVKAQLLQPKSANRVIAQLRALPISDSPAPKKSAGEEEATPLASGPIHAVCLEYSDEEVHDRHFSRLEQVENEAAAASEFIDFPSVATATIETLTSMFEDMHLVSLIKAPNMGFGQPGDGEGILAGAVPTAETIINGVEQVTPQLMALGFATGRAIVPDHTGIYPPTDRISVLTYWWGLEIVLPSPTLVYLSRTQSISNAIINFLTALSLINNGVREILPFVRYIAQFIDFEFKSIQQQNRGKGVVCAATWIMPAAMVPRPWDFPSPPPQVTEPKEDEKPEDEKPSTDVDIPVASPTGPDEPASGTIPDVPESARPSDDSSEAGPVSSAPPVLPNIVVKAPSDDDGAETLSTPIPPAA